MKCELHRYANHTCIGGEGNTSAKVVIVGDNPNWTEDNKGEYGHGKSAELVRSLAHSAQIKDYYYTPVIRCRKPDRGKISATILKSCKPYLLEELEQMKPDFVITLGSTALKALTNKAKITEIHGKILDHKSGFKVLPTFHPSMSIRDPRFWSPIHTDFNRFGWIIRGEGLTEHNLKFKRIVDSGGLKEVLERVAKVKELSFDLETNGLQMRYKTSRIGQSVIGTWRMVYVVEHEEFSRSEMSKFHCELSQLVRDKKKKVIMANGKFDNLWLYYRHGVMIPIHFDTQLASHLIDENSPNGLKENAQRYLDAGSWDVPLHIKNGKGKNKQGLTEEEKEQRAEYAAWDGYYTLRLYRVLRDLLEEDPELSKVYYQLVMPVESVYEVVETNGIYLDLDKMREADKILSRKMRIVLRSLSRWGNINWNSTDQLAELLFGKLGIEPAGYTEGGAPSTSEDNLKRIEDKHPAIKKLIEYRRIHKQKTGFVDGWEKRMINGQLFPSFKISGTVTGRPSCSDPNLQQVPRDIFIRSLIGAPPGWEFFEADYSQLELRLTAAASRDRKMLSIFRSGGDIHEATYREVMGQSTEDAVAHIKDPDERKAQLKEERKKAKAINFGFIYGMGSNKFMEYAETKMGLKVTEAEAREYRRRFFEVYADLPAWHERQRRIVRSLGQVRTMSGRIRHLPQINSPDKDLRAEAERQAINSPIQGFGAEMILMSLVEIQQFFQNKLVKVGGTIHDAIVGIVKKEFALPCMARIKYIMENSTLMKEFNIDLPLPIIADVSVGNWGIGKEYAEGDLPEPILLHEALQERRGLDLSRRKLSR